MFNSIQRYLIFEDIQNLNIKKVGFRFENPLFFKKKILAGFYFKTNIQYILPLLHLRVNGSLENKGSGLLIRLSQSVLFRHW